MLRLLSLAGCAAFVALLFVGAWALCPYVFAALGLDWPGYEWQYAAEVERGQELSRQSQFVQEQIHAKNAIARELIAGRLSLAEATRQFEEMPIRADFVRPYVRERFPGATDEEGMTQYVLNWACDLLHQEPSRAEALRRRLEAELNSR
jgi:hypothetical protein